MMVIDIYSPTVIDLFSRYAWAKPIKDKTGNEVKHAFHEIFALGRKCERLQTDEGREFLIGMYNDY